MTSCGEVTISPKFYAQLLGTQIPKAQKNLWLDYVFFALFEIFAPKSSTSNVGEIDTWAQFHHCSTYSFYASRSRMHKKDSQVSCVIWRFWDLLA
jgi:hypothetical protein